MIRRIAATLTVSGLAIGLIGAGVAAQFTDTNTATATVSVGSFGCVIAGTDLGVIAPDAKSVTYTATPPTSSAADTRPFSFTVRSTGSIPVKLHVTQTNPGAPFSSLLAPPTDVTLTQGETHAYAAGIQWGALGMADLHTTRSVVYTIRCVEAATTFTSAVFPSTNADNMAKTAPLRVGQDAPYVVATATGPGTMTITFNAHLGYQNCFEYRVNGAATTDPRANFNTDIHDGLWPFACVNGSPVVVNLTGVQYVEVRMSFGAERDFRFDWTRFDALS